MFKILYWNIDKPSTCVHYGDKKTEFIFTLTHSPALNFTKQKSFVNNFSGWWALCLWMRIHAHTHTRMHTPRHHSIIFITKACGAVWVRALSEKQKLWDIYRKRFIAGINVWDCRGWRSKSEIHRASLQEGRAGTLRPKNGYPQVKFLKENCGFTCNWLNQAHAVYLR